jgi:hypothetical protein
MTELFDGRLYLGGGIECAYDDDWLRLHRITHVLNCALETHQLEYPAPVTAHKLPLTDNEETELTAVLLQEGVAVLDAWLSVPGAVVLVHCLAGVSRSATVVLLYCTLRCPANALRGAGPLLIADAASPLRYLAWLAWLKARRPCVRPYTGFLQLVEALAAAPPPGACEAPSPVALAACAEQSWPRWRRLLPW